MAWYSGFRKYNKFYRKNYNWSRYRYNGNRKLKMSRGFKNSAANMTQNGMFNINVVFPVTLNCQALRSNGAVSPYYGGFSVVDVPGSLFTSPMHAALKKVFDQYRIEKVNVKVALGALGASSGVGSLFACVDRTGFDTATAETQFDLANIRSYGSYKERAVSGDTTASGALNMPISQTDVVGLSLYRDTYSTVTFPKVLVGYSVLQEFTNTVNLQIEIDAQVRYRGVRLSNKV